MSRQRRLRSARDFGRVRQAGRSYAATHLVISVAKQATAVATNDTQLVPPSRVGFSVGRRVGNAVVRNRVRRRLRELMRPRLAHVAPGWDVVVGARAAAAASSYSALDRELDGLLTRAKVLASGSEARSV
jgi:ribonuclease P protein component